ncbi:hypothetical protein ACF3MZ_00440 [Paenibacillaceae bacterium WGS1546]|uniref:hypothetical protein n=1 Tax=Cohnella sp. WGS1546 TaxID=3366810 RepID=UPI00372D4C97
MKMSTDRWLEMDLSWFDPQTVEDQAKLLFSRVDGLYQGVEGYKGIILNCGWVIDLVTEWTGDGDQPLPFLSNMMNRWKTRSYSDLKALFEVLRKEAGDAGIRDFKLGVLFFGWGQLVLNDHIYDVRSNWYERHKELYMSTGKQGKDLDPRVELNEDQYPYATRAQGIAKGTSFSDFFADQWGALSRFLDLNAIHLRDQFMGAMVYDRNGPFGEQPPADPETVFSYSQGFIGLFRAVKAANPDALVMGYSSAISAVAEWRVGCVDLELLVADGAIDIWIDQTWGGAWQDWWSTEWKGWTFQLANLMMHRVIVDAGNRKRQTAAHCRHYHLIETWDGWEPWDTLHQVPNKLRWGIWAFAHAASHSPQGFKTTDGAYISWLNNREGQLLSEKDVQFLTFHINAAQQSAERLEHIYGPEAVYNRAVLKAVTEHETTAHISEWIDDQTAMLVKWGSPILAATRLEWLRELPAADAYVLQVPGQPSDAERESLIGRAAASDVPCVLVGRADWIDPEVLRLAGAEVSGDPVDMGYYKVDVNYGGEYHAVQTVIQLPDHETVTPHRGAEILARTDRTPLIVRGRQSRTCYWQPQDLRHPGLPFLIRPQLGDVLPFAVMSASLLDSLKEVGKSYIQPFRVEATAAFHYWKSGGKLHMLLGNLETGLTGDSRWPRQIIAVLRKDHLQIQGEGYALQDLDDGKFISPTVEDREEIRFDLLVPPEGSKVFVLTQR